MKIPNHYLALKPFLDWTLFGRDDVNDYFKKENKLKFSSPFMDYQTHFLANDDDKHLLLLLNLSEYCEEMSVPERENIVKVILENNLIANATALATCLNEGRAPNREQYTFALLRGLQKFVKDGKLNAQMEYFFLIFFRNFEDINPRKYTNWEVDSSEYSDLISQYLKLQTDFSFA